MRPLTERQIAALKRLAKDEHHRCHFSPDLAKQLDKRGVAELTGHKHTRYEWQRPVATLWEVRLTTAGRNVLPLILPPGTLVWDHLVVDGKFAEGVYVATDDTGRFRATDTVYSDAGRWKVEFFAADGDQFETRGHNRDDAAKELKEMAALAKEKAAAINEVESRY